jgi:parvulin-like peptidyl-prolyl isomerase
MLSYSGIVGNVHCLNIFFSREVSKLAGKHRKEKIVRAPSKHQLSKWEREKKISRIIKIAAVALIVLVACFIGISIYFLQIQPFEKAVVKVNETSFTLDYYIKYLDAMTKGQSKDSIQNYADMAVSAIQQGAVIKTKAAEVGIKITDDEISQAVTQSGFDKNQATADLAELRLISNKYAEQQCLPSLPKSVLQAEVQAMALETEAMAKDRLQKLAAGDNFTAMAGQLSIDPVTKSKSGYLGWIPKGYENYALGNLRDAAFIKVIFNLEAKTWSDPIFDGALSKPYGYWVVEVLEKDDTKGTHARGILFSQNDQATEVRGKLVNGGSWEELAKQYSQHESKDNGGDLGWIQPGTDDKLIVRILSAQEKNVISDVIRDDTVTTKGGYWIARAADLQERPLSSSIMQALVMECFQSWVIDITKDTKTENLLTQDDKTLAIAKISKLRSK